MRRSHTQPARSASMNFIDLTPLIDVMVVLVILLVLGSTFGLVTDTSKLHASEGDSYVQSSGRRIVISFDEEDSLKLDGIAISRDELADTVAVLAAAGDVGFVLSGSTAASYGLFLDVEDVLKESGVEQYQRVYRRKEK